jgi:hypothetical protein
MSKNKIPLILEVENFIKSFATTLTKPQFIHFEQIIKGINFSSKKSINQYSKSSIRNQSSLCRFMNSDFVKNEEISSHLKNLIKSNIDYSKDIDFIIDDTIKHHKYAKHIYGLGNHHDHLNGGYSNGQNIVTCGIYQDKKFYPTNFKLYLRQEDVSESSSFKTKLEIAQSMIDEWINNVHNFLFDSWYASQDILKTIHKRKKFFFTMLKKDRLVKINKRIKRQLQEQNKYLNPKKYEIITIGKKTFSVQEMKVYLPKVGYVKILFSKFYDKKTKFSKDLHYLCTNNLNLSMEEILIKYQDRWPIETFYRDIKQNLGFEKSIIRNKIGTKRHILFSFIAHNILIFSKEKIRSSGQVQEEIKYSYIKNTLQNYGLKGRDLNQCFNQLKIIC